MYSLENKSEESRAFQSNPEKQLPTAQFKDNRAQSPIGTSDNTVQREKRANLTGMPDDLKSGIESLSGFSMDDVRVHYNSSKPATVQALAYTQGTDIHVAPGQEKHLPHEAWHVAQQMAGRVSPTTNINGMPVNDNAELEHEADVMGEKAVLQREKNAEFMKPKYFRNLTIQCVGEWSQDWNDARSDVDIANWEWNITESNCFGKGEKDASKLKDSTTGNVIRIEGLRHKSHGDVIGLSSRQKKN